MWTLVNFTLQLDTTLRTNLCYFSVRWWFWDFEACIRSSLGLLGFVVGAIYYYLCLLLTASYLTKCSNSSARICITVHTSGPAAFIFIQSTIHSYHFPHDTTWLHLYGDLFSQMSYVQIYSRDAKWQRTRALAFYSWVAIDANVHAGLYTKLDPVPCLEIIFCWHETWPIRLPMLRTLVTNILWSPRPWWCRKNRLTYKTGLLRLCVCLCMCALLRHSLD